MKLRDIGHWLIPVLLWLPVVLIMELEWRYNEQYGYGYFVPFFTLYLVYLRWGNRPEGSKPTCHWMLLLGIGLLTIPVQLIATANPDWRNIYWIASAVALAATLLYLDQLGGRKWLFHFFPAFAMMLFAVPWGTQFETRVTSDLMRVVSAFTVEVINLIGIYAVQMGNVIRLPENIVGVEEACSGVRSLQSSLMAGYLFGELFRLRPAFRILLIVLSIGLTFVINLIRTIALTLITHNRGTEGFERWHDPLGIILMVAGFAGIALLTWLIVRLPKSRTLPSRTKITSTEIRKLPRLVLLSIVAVLALAPIMNYLWYLPARHNTDNVDFLAYHWNSLSDEIRSEEISPVTKAQLKYSEGHHYSWEQKDGTHWIAYYFRWDTGAISSHAGVHRPENCLPASGLTYQKTYEPLIWEDPRGIEIPFRCLTFKGYGGQIFVFFTVWDENGDQPWFSLTWQDRLQDVIHRRLVDGRHSLEFFVKGAETEDQAKQLMMDNLTKLFGESSGSTNESGLR